MTSLLVNLSTPRAAPRAAALPVAGVGLMRAEFLIYSLGRHPGEIMASQGSADLTAALRNGMIAVAAAFRPRPVRYRSLDFKSNEMRTLAGGDIHEPVEGNPALGHRGASRYARDRDIFMAELDALRMARADGCTNLQLMIPFVRSCAELEACRAAIEDAGIDDGLELWAMLEIPAMIYMVGDLARYVTGVSIGSNDLTQLMLGVDRDNSTVAQLYDDGHPAVSAAIRAMIDGARRAGLQTSICGDRPSRDAGFTRMLLDAGIDSISVTPDAVEATAEIIEAAASGR
jgi:pyruvate,water dikinase